MLVIDNLEDRFIRDNIQKIVCDNIKNLKEIKDCDHPADAKAIIFTNIISQYDEFVRHKLQQLSSEESINKWLNDSSAQKIKILRLEK